MNPVKVRGLTEVGPSPFICHDTTILYSMHLRLYSTVAPTNILWLEAWLLDPSGPFPMTLVGMTQSQHVMEQSPVIHPDRHLGVS